jgi:hypothetical protein
MDELRDPEDTINRLLLEIRQKDELLGEIKKALFAGYNDHNLLTVVGAAKKLVLDRENALDKVRALEKELNRMIRKI